jgi:hypothetical protein
MMSNNQESKEILKIRLYPGQDDDLLRWARSLESLPFGGKTQAIKAALLRGIRAGAKDGEAAALVQSPPQLMQGLISELQDALLPYIRATVEAAVSSALARAGSLPAHLELSQAPTSEVEELLDALGSSLLLEDDETL